MLFIEQRYVKTEWKTENGKRNGKWKIPSIFLEGRNLCLNSYKNRELKVKNWISWKSRKKKECIFCNVYFV